MPSHQLSHEDFEKMQPSIRSPDEEAALMLEDIALGNRMNRRRAASQLEPNSTLGRAQTFSIETVLTPPILAEQGMYPFPKNPSPSSQQLPPFGLPSEHPLSLLVDPSTNVVHLIVSILPDEAISRRLVEFYFERIEWYTKIFHYPTFMSDVDNLLTQISLFSSHTAASPNPPRISFPFLSTFFMVLCLAHHFIEPEVCAALNMNFADATASAKKFYNAAQVCLWIDNFLANHSLEAVQSLILMGIYQQNLDDSDSHWALLGSAIKIAQNLGLARLGSESDTKAYSGPWKSVIRREVARRVWWNLIYGDWSHAAAHNGVYAVHPSQNGTGYPANINDVELVDGQPLNESSSTQYTEMTYSLARFRFVEIYRQIVDNMENPTGYGFIVDTDARLRDMLEVDLPAMFQAQEGGSPLDTGPSLGLKGIKGMEYTISVIMGETRRLRLHRPFLFRGYKDRKYGKSKEQCIASARAVLNILKSDPEQAGSLLKWWLIMFYGFAAAVVLFIDFCHLRGDDPAALEARKKELHDALNLFKQAQHLSGVSQNAITLLEGMMTAAEQRASSNGSRKRSAPDDNERWDRVAKKTIVSANRMVGLTRSPQISGAVPSAIPSKYDAQSPELSSSSSSSKSADLTLLSPMTRSFPSPPPVPYHSSLSPHTPSTSSHSPHPFSQPGGGGGGGGGGVVWSHTTSTSTLSHSHSHHSHQGHGHGHGGRDVFGDHGGMFSAKDWNLLDSTAKVFDDVTISELGLLWSGEDPYAITGGGGGFDAPGGGGGGVGVGGMGHESHWGGLLGGGGL
ncbi:hypothetical protein L218DRAFT_968251 [Marasmius fiardii PR-910]|nr:hypothetical protein L218DRAFT_968251 [Marasmius fiardii PR-910]